MARAPTLATLASEAEGEARAAPSFAVPRLHRATLNDEVYHELKRAISAGAIEPGQAMTIRALAASFGISLMPVREALNRLVAEHVLVQLPNRSVALPRIGRERFREITRIRVALEGLAAEEACPRISPAEIERLERLNQRIEGTESVTQALADNREFHFTLYRAAAMPTLVALIETHWLQAGPLLQIALREMVLKRRLDCHRALLRALRQRDAAAARAAIIADLEEAAVPIARHLGDG